MTRLRTVFALLLTILLLASCTGQLTKEQAYHYLHLLNAQNQSDTVFRSDTLQLAVANYFDRHGKPNERMLAHYLLGRARHDMGNAPNALDCYQMAAACADTSAADCDYNLLLRIYSQAALLFHLQGLPEQEREALAFSEKYAWKAKDTLMAIGARGHQIGPYFLEGKYDDVIRICQWASREYEKAGYKQVAAMSLFSIIHILVERGSYAEAIPLLERYERESGCVEGHEAARGHELYYYEKGAVELHLGHTEQADTFFRKLLSDDADYNNLQAAYKGLLSVYERQGIADSIAKYALLYAAATDSSYKDRSTADVARVNALYKYDKAQLEVQQEQEKRERLYFIIAFIVVVSLFCLLWMQQMTRAKRERMRNALHLENQRYLMLLSEYQKLTKAVSALTEENASLEDHYKKQMDELRTELTSYLGQDMNDADWEEMPDLSGSEIVLHLHKYAATVKEPSLKEWKELYQECERRYPDFLSAINNFTKHDLSASEKQICILFMMQFTKSEIIALLKITSQSLTNYCTRINKKLFHATGAKGIEFNLRNMTKHR